MILPEPDFIDRDPRAITADLVAQYEATAGKTLYPAQVERLLIDVVAYAKTMTHVGIQEAAKQNLVRYARAPMLDYLGELIALPRLAAASSGVTLRFDLSASRFVAVAIPAGTRVESGDGKVAFMTSSDATIPAGSLSVEVSAFCVTAGVVGNGWQVGQLTVLASDLGDVAVVVTNTTVSVGGADAEDDERYRARLMDGPERLAAAGPRGAYRAHAMAAHQDIIDVGVIGPALHEVDGEIVSSNGVQPGLVHVYPMVAGGAPDAALLAKVVAALNDDLVRPVCDYVLVLPPMAADYAINANLTLASGANSTTVLAAARAAADAYAADRAAGLGRDVVPSQVIAVLSVPGVYQVELAEPALSVLDLSQWARCTGITLTVAGMANGG